MKSILSQLYKIEYKEVGNNNIQIIGRYISVFSFLPIFASLSLPLFLHKIEFLFIPILSILFIPISLFASRFRIKISSEKVQIIQFYFGVSVKSIESDTSKIIISHPSFSDVNCINPRKDYYSEDIKGNLRFSYIMPWDDDKENLYIDYLGKELSINFWDSSGENIWKYLIKGFKKIDELLLSR